MSTKVDWNIYPNMAAMEDDVFFDALQKHCKIIESALMSKCNMNNQVREDARQALELKASVPKRRNPAIIVKNVPNEVNNEDILKVITEQNPEIVVDDESIRQCKVRFTLKTFQHTRHVVIETHPTKLSQAQLRLLFFLLLFRAFKNIDSDLHKISQVFSSKNLNRLVWSMDSNSKSELWFSPYSDARGNKLSEFISANNLFIINEDCGPTFRATQGTSYIDITVVGSDLLEDNSSWCLSENESLSDHVMIEFEFCLSTVLRDTSSAPFVIFNTKKANWCRFRKFCLSRMTHIFDTLNSCTNSSCLNTVIEELSFVIHQACLYSIPIKKTSKHNVPWWYIEIGCARKRLNASRRRFQRCKNPTVRELYKNSYLEYRKDYNQMLINAKSESWKKFLLTIDAQNVWKKKSFPSDSEEKDNIFQKDYRHAARTAYPSFFDPSFSYDEVNTMVSMLKLNKSPGPDSISNEIIKQFHLAFPSFLHKLFNVFLGLGIFPRIWKLAQVILIPKVNEFRVPHLDNLRCISLLPALGKCLEKLFVNRISWYLRHGDFFSSDQYGFTPHKSTEDALLRLNEIVKRGKKKHLLSILISLDIKGAFDNAWWPCILNLLKKAEIPINIFSLVADFLNDRVAKMQLGSTSAIRCLERGCPQGSVSGPIFWNIIINDLLSKLNNLACCEIIAFADDILVCS
ncbi:retrovirus-related Pol polyprotein from type-1 retrotransposable element R1 [Trichonephila clavipes]|nr:retrovirus-related Pol polyprotein from type-1 retrotransposable element R1 [Trichonephila clavipes]